MPDRVRRPTRAGRQTEQPGHDGGEHQESLGHRSSRLGVIVDPGGLPGVHSVELMCGCDLRCQPLRVRQPWRE